jgi:thioredoxin 1
MKRRIILALLALFLITGCNSQAPAEKTAAPVEVKDVVKPVKLNKQQFLQEIVDYEANPKEWIYKGELPGLVDFYADWCRPCRMTSPIMEELAQEYAGQIRFYKVDIQVEQELAAVFGIESIPAFLFIPMNDKPVMSAGIAQTPEATKQLFKKQIDEILLKKKNPIQ